MRDSLVVRLVAWTIAVTLDPICAFAQAVAGSGAAAVAKPNIIVILADDLGYGDLAVYGGTEIPTPNLDGLARAGVRFTDGYVTCPICAPTRAGLMSGRYQQRFGFEHNPGPEAQASPRFGLPRSERTLAEKLKDAGYATGMFGKWHIGYKTELQPHQRGFDEFFGFLSGAHTYMPGEGSGRRGGGYNEGIVRNGTLVEEKEYLTDAFAREAAAFISKHATAQREGAGTPYFVYLPFNAVHGPMEATRKYTDRFAHITDANRRTYAGMVTALDEAVGRVLAAVKESGQEDHTLVFFFGDNGGPTPQTTSSNAPLSGYKGQVLEGGVRVPFLMKWPGGGVPAGRVYEQPVMSLDVHATVLAAAGFDLNAPANREKTDKPETPRLEGRDLLPFVTAAGERGKVGPHQALFWRMGNQWAVRKGDWKLLSQARQNARQPGEVRLYNLREDIGEKNDLAAKMPEKVAELRAAYDAWNAGNIDPLWRRSEARDADSGGGGEAGDGGAVPMPTPANYGAAHGPYKVETSLGAWKDEARAREVPYKAYLPAGAPGSLPLVVISHGGGGSRDAQTFLAEHLASHGYAIVAAQHAGSDLTALRKDGRLPRALRGALQAIVDDQRNWSDRPKDISFLLDRVLAGGLGERVTIDHQRVAVLGHSFGAYTAMAIGGMLVDLDGKPDTSFRDARVHAVIACSPQGVNQFGISEGAWSKFDVPVMMLTGSKDTGLKEGEPWTWRRQAFDAMKARATDGPFYLAVINDAGHMAFADETNAILDGVMGGRDPKFHGWIQQLGLAFLDTHLRNDDLARMWLAGRGIEADAERRVSLELGGRPVDAPLPEPLPENLAGGNRPQGEDARGRGAGRIREWFDRLDTNKDGSLSAEEYNADRAISARRPFAEIDANKDGNLSYKEIAAAFGGGGQGRQGGGD